MSSLAITPKVTSDYTYTLIGSQKELQVMLLWRGQPGWYYGSARQNIALPMAGAGDTVPVQAEITRGATTVRFAIYGTERVMLFDTTEILLDSANAILADLDVSPGAATVIAAIRLDPTFGGATSADGRRASVLSQAAIRPVLQAFLELP
jgi:hypothetical protein